MKLADQLSALRSAMERRGIDLLLGFHDGAHFIEKPDAVMALSGFKVGLVSGSVASVIGNCLSSI